MEFVYFKHKFQNEFVHESCWDLVEPKLPIIVVGVSTPDLQKPITQLLHQFLQLLLMMKLHLILIVLMQIIKRSSLN